MQTDEKFNYTRGVWREWTSIWAIDLGNGKAFLCPKARKENH